MYEKETPVAEKEEVEKRSTRNIRRRGIYDEKLLFNIFIIYFIPMVFFPGSRIKYNSFQTIAY